MLFAKFTDQNLDYSSLISQKLKNLKKYESLDENGFVSLWSFPTLGLKTKRDIKGVVSVDKEHEIERR